MKRPAKKRPPRAKPAKSVVVWVCYVDHKPRIVNGSYRAYEDLNEARYNYGGDVRRCLLTPAPRGKP